MIQPAGAFFSLPAFWLAGWGGCRFWDVLRGMTGTSVSVSVVVFSNDVFCQEPHGLALYPSALWLHLTIWLFLCTELQDSWPWSWPWIISGESFIVLAPLSGPSPLHDGQLLLHLLLSLLHLVLLHPPGLPEHLEAEEEHDGRAGVVGDLPGDEGGHHPAQQRGEDRHEVESGEGGEEDDEFVVPHSPDQGGIQLEWFRNNKASKELT